MSERSHHRAPISNVFGFSVNIKLIISSHIKIRKHSQTHARPPPPPPPPPPHTHPPTPTYIYTHIYRPEFGKQFGASDTLANVFRQFPVKLGGSRKHDNGRRTCRCLNAGRFRNNLPTKWSD